MKDYEDFEVWIGMPAEAGKYPVNIFSSPAGPAAGVLELDLGSEQLAQFKKDLVKVQGIVMDQQLRESVGNRLFEELFKSDVRDVWNSSKGRVAANAASQGLRLRLWVNPPELAALPWELLFESGEQKFMATSSSFAVSRYLPVPEPPFYSAKTPLQILLVTQAPQGYAIKEAEITRIETALQKLAGKVEYRLLRDSSLAEIQNALQEKEYHVLHYLGHGTSGELFMISDDKQSKVSRTDAQFAQLFIDRRSLRLIVLNACDSAQANTGGIFTGIGPALVRKGIPAVVAMQYPFVQADIAGIFSERFYGSLANGLPVDVAVNQARQFLSTGELLAARDWSTPVLYLGTRNGRILNLLSETANQVEQAWHSVQAVAQGDNKATAALDSLAKVFRELAGYHSLVRELMELSDLLRGAREEFEPCETLAKAVAAWDMAKIAPLTQAWNKFQQSSLLRLKTFMSRMKGLDAGVYQAFQNSAAIIDNQIRQGVFQNLQTRCQDFGRLLEETGVQVQLKISSTMNTMLDLSNQTLGRLSL
ncbi:MAG: CHAT domain-containing protein [Blastocatellia bacterium]